MENVSISRLHNNPKSANICGFCKYYYLLLCKHWPISGGCSNLKFIHFPINNQDPSKILNIFVLNVHLKKKVIWHTLYQRIFFLKRRSLLQCNISLKQVIWIINNNGALRVMSDIEIF